MLLGIVPIRMIAIIAREIDGMPCGMIDGVEILIEQPAFRDPRTASAITPCEGLDLWFEPIPALAQPREQLYDLFFTLTDTDIVDRRTMIENVLRE